MPFSIFIQLSLNFFRLDSVTIYKLFTFSKNTGFIFFIYGNISAINRSFITRIYNIYPCRCNRIVYDTLRALRYFKRKGKTGFIN